MVSSPCSCVVIWNYRIGQHERGIQDMRQQTFSIVSCAIGTFLR